MANGITMYDRDHHVRLLQRGASFSLFGSKTATVAYPMLVLLLTHSPFKAGWVGCAVMAPSILAYVPAGALVDRWPPRRAMMVSEFLRGLAILGFILLIGFLRARSFPWLIIPALFDELLGVFSMLAERCYVRRLVEDDIPTPALARSEAHTHTVIALGRPLGGFLFEANPLLPFFFDFVTFVVSVTLLVHLRSRELGQRFASVIISQKWLSPDIWRGTGESGVQSSGRLTAEISDGLKWIYQNKFARVAIPLSASSSIVAQALVIIFLVLASRRGLSPVVLGAALGASGLGGALGSVVESRIRKHFRPSWMISLMWIWAVALAAGVLFDSYSLDVLPVVMVVFGFTGALGNIELTAYLMTSAEESMLGRVLSIRQLCSFIAYAVGPVLGGLLAGYDLSGGVRFLFCLALAIAIVSSGALMWSYQRPPADLHSFWRPPALEPETVPRSAADLVRHAEDSGEGRVTVAATP